MYTLAETELLKINKIVSENDEATFVIEPLLPGYGMTIGNALRRILLSSLSGSAITSVKINGVTHEFSTLKGVKEDVVEIILNLKLLRVKSHSDEPVTIKLSQKGPGKVMAKSFQKNALVDIIDPGYHIATLDKNGKLELEAVIEHGRGYVPTEKRQGKLPLGTIAIDSIFTPIKKVHYQVENTRVGGMTNFDKIIFTITTDGTITPDKALSTAIQILIDHFSLLSQLISKLEPKKTIKSKKITKKNLVKKISKPLKKKTKPERSKK